ncbi:MAG: helix-turn-helix domain-containing protein [Planctomycetota bacterium]
MTDRSRTLLQAQPATKPCINALLQRKPKTSGETAMIQSNPQPTERLGYSRVEAAEILSVSVRTIDNLIADKTTGFPVRRIGRKVVIPRRELELWLDEQTEQVQQRRAARDGGD